MAAFAAAALAVAALAPTGVDVFAGEPAPAAKKKASERHWTQAEAEAAASSPVLRKHVPSDIIFPKHTLPLRFSHGLHLEQGATCTDCHGGQVLSGPGIAKSVRAEDVSLPLEATCFNCHFPEDGADGDPPSACSTCHPGYQPSDIPEDIDGEMTKRMKNRPPAVFVPEPHIKMNHARHIQLGIDCAACHGSMKEVDFAVPDNAFPVMGNCLKCHNGQKREYTENGEKVVIQAPQECRTCHKTDGDGRIDQTLPTGVLKPAGWYHQDAHDDQWLKKHKEAAQLGDGYCANCHAPKFCVDCHNGVQKPLKIHPNNWILAHPIAARRNDPDCQSCHRTQTFCLDCHMTLKVDGDPKEPNNRPRTLEFHPPGWEGGDHAFEAKRNIRACASCHTEETCLQCHASQGKRPGSLGMNPHPPGFRLNDCERMKRMNPRVCTKCHTVASPEYNCR